MAIVVALAGSEPVAVILNRQRQEQQLAFCFEITDLEASLYRQIRQEVSAPFEVKPTLSVETKCEHQVPFELKRGTELQLDGQRPKAKVKVGDWEFFRLPKRHRPLQAFVQCLVKWQRVVAGTAVCARHWVTQDANGSQQLVQLVAHGLAEIHLLELVKHIEEPFHNLDAERLDEIASAAEDPDDFVLEPLDWDFVEHTARANKFVRQEFEAFVQLLYQNFGVEEVGQQALQVEIRGLHKNNLTTFVATLDETQQIRYLHFEITNS